MARWVGFHADVACIALGVTLILCQRPSTAVAQGVDREGLWVTTADRKQLLVHYPLSPGRSTSSDGWIVKIDRSETFQRIVGFGGTLTDGSLTAIGSLEEADQRGLLDELFLPAPQGMGWDVIRIPVGASDLSPAVYTYNDSETDDPDLSRFDLAPAMDRLVPMMRAIAQRQPNVKWMATPWTAPSWMKDNRRSIGGSLLPKYYSVYAKYLTRYLLEMKRLGFTIDYLTVQNEPENPHNNPSMLMTAAQQAQFIGGHLGPRLREAGLSTKILAFDHNCDHPEYPIAVLSEPMAEPMVHGSAFHLYAGEPRAMSLVHDRFPSKEIHFTEQWVSSDGDFGGDLVWHAENVLIGATRNWAMSVLEWNLASDANQDPHTEGGCDKCLGALTIDRGVRRNVAYYVLTHGSKFVPAGSVRIGSHSSPGSESSGRSQARSEPPQVAFQTPDGRVVLLMLHRGETAMPVTLEMGDERYHWLAPPRSLVTWVGHATAADELR